MYVGFAYGDQSRELAEALWRDREFGPLDRFSQSKAGARSREAYVSCLLRWGYIQWNPTARRAQQQYAWDDEAKHRRSPLNDATVEKLYHGD
jgi:hypothetical protein